MPLSQAILFETFSEEERGKAMAIFGVGTTLAPALGLPIGGWIADNWTWRWIFYINLPIGIISIFLILAYIKDPTLYENCKTENRHAGHLGNWSRLLCRLSLTRDSEKIGSPLILYSF